MHQGETTEEFLARVQANIDKTNELLKVAQEKIAETDRLHEEMGVTREEVARRLTDPSLPEETKKLIEEIQKEVDEELGFREMPTFYTPEKEQEHRNAQLNAMKNHFRI